MIKNETKNGPNYINFLVALEREQREWLAKTSLETGISVSHMLRVGVNLYIEKYGPKLEHITKTKK